MPALQSFCLYCAVGIFLVYIFQATFFTAFLALDLRRIRANRNSFLPCIKHKKSEDLEDSTALRHQIGWRKNPGKIFFRKYGEILMHPISKTLVICLTIGLTGVGKCTISENVVFEKWNISTNGEANQNNFINEWRGEAESWVYEIILICQVMSCDISFHKNHFFRNFISKIIVYDGLCNKFWEMILRNDISWH